jgi:hypothetical protein
MKKFAETVNKRAHVSDDITAEPGAGQNEDTVLLTSPARTDAFPLLHSTEGFNDGSTVPLSRLAGITPGTLVKDYGYAPEEAAEAVRTLGSYALPQEAAARYGSIAQQITHLFSQGTTADVFSRNMSSFAGSFRMPQYAAGVYSADTGEGSNLTPFMQLFSTPRGESVPLSFGSGTGHTDGMREHDGHSGMGNTAEILSAGSTAQTENLPAAEGIMSGSAFVNTAVSESVHAAKTSPHLYNNVPVETPALSPEDREAERMARINAHYEHDRAVLAREKTPALARSDTHDVGHAEGVEQTGNIDKTASQVNRDILNQLRADWN